MRLHGKTTFVAGAASGIGRAVAREFLSQGAHVLAADIDSAGLSVLEHAVSIHLDVTSEDSWLAAFQPIDSLDVFVLAAGISYAKPTLEMPLADWRQVMAVNLDGAFLGVRSALRMMAPQKKGSIILIGSASGIKPAAGASAYCASKAGLRMFTKSVALEAKEHGVRVNCVSPAGVATPMWTKMPFWKDLVAQHGSEEAAWKSLGGIDPSEPSLKRMAMPEEIAKAVLFLASDDSAHITGTDLAVDAGYTA